MKKIIVTGYPKSGNTWVCRLTAELVGCPVKGFWNSRHREAAVEGKNRKSEYGAYKSHHQLEELMKKGASDHKIIYVIRDPRDIILSGVNYFDFSGYKPVSDFIKRNLELLGVRVKWENKTSFSKSKMPFEL